MHVEKLRKNDIILNHQQTMSLLKLGRAAGEGKAFADGTAPGAIHLMPSHAISNSVTGAFKGGQKYTKYGLGTANDKAAKYTQKNTQATQSNTDATESNTEAQDEQAETYDWVATVIERAGQKTERIVNQISDYVTNTFRRVKLEQQLSSIENQLEVAKKAVAEYSAYLDGFTVSDDSAKDAEYKNKIMNGTIQIEEISDEQIKENINRFQEYYNKMIEAQDSLADLNNSMLEAYSSLINMPIENTQKKLDDLSEAFDKLSTKSEMSKTTISAYYKVLSDNLSILADDGSELYNSLAQRTEEIGQMIGKMDYKYQNAYVDKTIDNAREQRDVSFKGAREASNNALSAEQAVADAIKALRNNGIDTSTANAGEMYDLDQLKNLSQAQINVIRDYNMAIQKNKIAQDGLKEANKTLMDSELNLANQIGEAGKKMLDNIEAYYDPRLQYQNTNKSRWDAKVEYKELTGQQIEKSDYDWQGTILRDSEKTLVTEVNELVASLDQSLRDGLIEPWSTQHYEELNRIESKNSELDSNRYEQVQLSQTVAEVPFKQVEQLIENVSSERNKLESALKIFNTQGYNTTESQLQSLQKWVDEQAELEQKLADMYESNVKAAQESADGLYGGHNAQYWKNQQNDHQTNANNLVAESEDVRQQIIQLPFDILNRDLEMLESNLSVIESELDFKEAMGQILQVSDYERKRAEILKQLEKQEEINRKTEEQLANTDPGTNQYLELTKQLDSGKVAVNGFKTELANVNMAITNVPLQNLQHACDILGAMADYYTGLIEINEIEGKYSTKEDYENAMNVTGEVRDNKEQAYNIAKENYEYAKDHAVVGADGTTTYYNQQNQEVNLNSLLEEMRSAWGEFKTATQEFYSNKNAYDQYDLTQDQRETDIAKTIVDKIGEENKTKQAAGAKLTEKDYMNEINAWQNFVREKSEDKEQLTKLRDQAIKDGRDALADDYQKQIDDLDIEMQQGTQTIETLGFAMRNLEIEQLRATETALMAARSYAEAANNQAEAAKINEQLVKVSEEIAQKLAKQVEELNAQGRTAEAEKVNLEQIEQETKTIEYTNYSPYSGSSEKPETTLEKLQRELGVLDSAADIIQAKMDLMENQSKDVAKELYNAEIASLQERIEKNRQIAEEAIKQYNKTKDSKEKSEFLSTAQDAESEIYNLMGEIEQLADEMRKVWITRPIDLYLDKLDQFRSSLNSISDLINDEMMFDDDGGLTDYGITAMAMNIKEYESVNESLRQLLEKRQAYFDEYNNGTNPYYSRVELEEDLKELTGEIQSMLGNAVSARQKIVDLITRAKKEEIDATIKVIEKRKELLNTVKNYYQWDKSLKDKTNDIALLEKQRKALEGLDFDPLKSI